MALLSAWTLSMRYSILVAGKVPMLFLYGTKSTNSSVKPQLSVPTGREFTMIGKLLWYVLSIGFSDRKKRKSRTYCEECWRTSNLE